MASLLLTGGIIVHSTGEQYADVLIEDGTVKKIGSQLSSDNCPSLEIKGQMLFPGLIDCHVHFREPGLTHKGNMRSESEAARAGGVTTVCEMPNTVPPTVTVAALADKVDRSRAIKACDIRFFMGATEKNHLLALRDIWRGESAGFHKLKERCCGLKLYFDHSTGDQGAAREVLEEAFRLCGVLNIPIVCHCEDPEIDRNTLRPPESEITAVALALDLARGHETHVHIAHLSTRKGVDLVREAKKEGVSATCEVAPHHLFLTTEDEMSLGTLGKVNPPLRSQGDRDALWEGIADGTVDCIASDHAPHTLEEKRQTDPLAVPSGIPGVETMFPLLLTVATGAWPHPRSVPPVTYHLTFPDIVRLCFENPNRIFGLGKRGITEGAPADLVLVDPKQSWEIRAEHLHSKCDWTPYEGWTVTRVRGV